MASAIEDVLGGVLGKAIGGGGDKGKLASALMPLIVSMLAGGGMSKIIDQMKKQGLSAQADSWLGNGRNLSITADQARKVVGDAQVKKIAGKIGMPEDQTAGLVAKALPAVVNHASPEGKQPSKASVDAVLKGKQPGGRGGATKKAAGRGGAAKSAKRGPATKKAGGRGAAAKKSGGRGAAAKKSTARGAAPKQQRRKPAGRAAKKG